MRRREFAAVPWTRGSPTFHCLATSRSSFSCYLSSVCSSAALFLLLPFSLTPPSPSPPLFVHGSVVLRRWRQRGVPSFRAALLRDLCVEQWCQGASKASASAAASACGELGHQDHRGAVWLSINTLSSRDLTGLGRCAVRCEQRRYRLAFRSRAGCAARALLYIFRSMV